MVCGRGAWIACPGRGACGCHVTGQLARRDTGGAIAPAQSFALLAATWAPSFWLGSTIRWAMAKDPVHTLGSLDA